MDWKLPFVGHDPVIYPVHEPLDRIRLALLSQEIFREALEHHPDIKEQYEQAVLWRYRHVMWKHWGVNPINPLSITHFFIGAKRYTKIYTKITSCQKSIRC